MKSLRQLSTRFSNVVSRTEDFVSEGASNLNDVIETFVSYPSRRAEILELMQDARTLRGVYGAEALDAFKNRTSSPLRRMLGFSRNEERALSSSLYGEAAIAEYNRSFDKRATAINALHRVRRAKKYFAQAREAMNPTTMEVFSQTWGALIVQRGNMFEDRTYIGLLRPYAL